VGIGPDDDTVEGSRRLSRVLGDDHADSLARDVRLQNAGSTDSLVRQPQGELGGIGHGPEILGRNAEISAGEGEIQEGAHLAVGLVRNERPGIIKQAVIPAGRRDKG